MASWEMESVYLNRWDVLNSCQGTFLDEIRLVSFIGENVRKRANWGLVVTSRDEVYTVGNIPAWASDREVGGGSGPLEIAALSSRGVVGLACGLEHCLALTNRGGVLSWGGNNHGQLGLGRRVGSSRVPVELPGLSQVTSVACGWRFSLALTQHEVYAWGDNRCGQCGSDSVDVCSPRRVELPAGVKPTSIACGWHHAVAVGSDGKEESDVTFTGGPRGCWSVLPLCDIKKSVYPPQADAVGGLASERGEGAEAGGLSAGLLYGIPQLSLQREAEQQVSASSSFWELEEIVQHFKLIPKPRGQPCSQINTFVYRLKLNIYSFNVVLIYYSTFKH